MFANKNIKSSTGSKKELFLDGVMALCKECCLIQEGLFVEKDVNQSFCLSMMTQIDELQSERIFTMQFVEFLECCARMADKYSPIPYYYEDKENLTQQDLVQLPLHIKLESLMIIFLKKVIQPPLKDMFPVPQESLFPSIQKKENSKTILNETSYEEIQF